MYGSHQRASRGSNYLNRREEREIAAIAIYLPRIAMSTSTTANEDQVETKRDFHERLTEWAKQKVPPSFPSSSSSSTATASSCSTSQPSTISISKQGDLAMICANNKLWIGTSQYRGNSERTIDLPSAPEKIITNIEFNFDGRFLMLYGPKYIGLISFPVSAMSRHTKDTENPSSSFLEKANLNIVELIADTSKDKDFKIIKCMWHPYSNKHIVILLEGLVGPLLVVDMILKNQNSL